MLFIPSASDDAWLSAISYDDLNHALSESSGNAFTESPDHAFTETGGGKTYSISECVQEPSADNGPTELFAAKIMDAEIKATEIKAVEIADTKNAETELPVSRKQAEAEAVQIRKADRAAAAEAKRVAVAAAKVVRAEETSRRGKVIHDAIRILCDALSAAGRPAPDVKGWQPQQRTKLGYTLTTWGEEKFSRAAHYFATGERGKRVAWGIGKFLYEAADFWETEPYTPQFRAGGANSGVVNGSVVNGAGVKRNGKLPRPVVATTYYNLDDVDATDFGMADICRLKLGIRQQGQANYIPPANANRRPEAMQYVSVKPAVSGLFEYQSPDDSYH